MDALQKLQYSWISTVDTAEGGKWRKLEAAVLVIV